jgi:hypothetical protein
MSLARKVRRAEEKRSKILENRTTKDVVKKQKFRDRLVAFARNLSASLLHASGHDTPEPRRLDAYHAAIAVRGTTISVGK